jgi:hypothetical protein
MSIGDRPESDRSARKVSISAAAGYVMLGAIIAGFLALHVWAGNIVLPGTTSAAATGQPVPLSGD